MSSFRLLMISAMYENGGNVTQRLLDGHPSLIGYPFESQPGTKYVQDHLSSLYPAKYRWPVFPLQGSVADDYETIIDEECKVRIKTPGSSKFRDVPLTLDDGQRKDLFVRFLDGRPRTRANLVEAFFRASGEAWTDRARSASEEVHVGYSPIVGVDADKIVSDFADSHVLNVVRNPWSAYADTRKRAVPLSLAHYMTGWSVHQQTALASAARFPGRVHILRYEDIVENPEAVLSDFLGRLGLPGAPSLARPTWNGKPMEQVHPWGTIRVPSPETNRATAAELSPAETEEIRAWTEPLLKPFGYSPPR